MKTKTLKLDWDGLEESFTNQNEELVYFLDLVNGQLKLEGEGVTETFDDDDDFDARAPAVVPSRRNDPTRAYVQIPTTAAKIVWLEAFLDAEEIDTEVSAELSEAMKGDDPAPAIRDILNRNTEIRDHWYVYRADRIREMIDAWLVEHHVVPLEPAPWKE